MKRSEMLNKISELINLIKYEDVINQSATDSVVPAFEYAEMVLSHIEKLGMMPPILEKESWKLLPNGEMTYAVHGWEFEDEKKN